MFQLDNHTDWSAAIYPGWGRNRKRQQTLVFKVGYSFDPTGGIVSLPSPPIEEEDRYSGDPEASSLDAAGETVPFKKGGEILLFGSAHPEKPGSTAILAKAGLRQRNDQFWEKELLVFGPRPWHRKLLMTIPGPPEAIAEPVPLTYENAYGGADPGSPERVFAANPAGTGFSFRGLRAKGLVLPRIECGPPFIKGPSSRVAPAGFGPLPPHWEPRSKEAVEIDGDAVAAGLCPWKKEPPESLYNTAPPDQRFDLPFEGEMTLSLTGMVADAPGEVLVNLPGMKPRVQFEQGESSTDQWALCDTLIVQADRMEIYMIFRCALPWSPKDNDHGLVVLRDLVAEAVEQQEEVEAVS